MSVSEALHKCNAYYIDTNDGYEIFVLGKFAWVKHYRSEIWKIVNVKRSVVLHEYLSTLISYAEEFNYMAGQDARVWARFLKSGRFTRLYGAKHRNSIAS